MQVAFILTWLAVSAAENWPQGFCNGMEWSWCCGWNDSRNDESKLFFFFFFFFLSVCVLSFSNGCYSIMRVIRVCNCYYLPLLFYHATFLSAMRLMAHLHTSENSSFGVIVINL